MIIDFHTHVLPGIDDGSKNVEMSLEMLTACGADVCVATPHFYGYRQRLDAWIESRSHAYERLKDCLPCNAPILLLGAETAYFPGMSKIEDLRTLCIERTNALLLELPFEPWNRGVMDEIENLSGKYHIILAHIDRYMGIRENRNMIDELQKMQVEIQINAEALLNFMRRSSIKRMISRDFLLGSDMHNNSKRPPNLLQGRNRVSAKQLKRMDMLGEQILADALKLKKG